MKHPVAIQKHSMLYYSISQTKVTVLFKDVKQTAGCTEFRTETGLRSLVSVQKFVHPAVCLPSLKKERTLDDFLL